MLDKNTALLLHRDVDSICSQIQKAYQELIDFIRTLTELDPFLADLLEQKISLADPELGDLLIRNKYYFELVLLLDDVAITEILKQIDKKTLTIALKGTDEALQNQFFRNMSSKAEQLMKEEMEFMGPVLVRDIRQCQREVVHLIKQLRDEGAIILGGTPGPADYLA
jgi:flagellar motor switch protein FliG